ncbi:glycosyltransferase family 2 protein [Enterococcus viikkiensis]|uniref:Glycosyltransferase family 2 protein n=1 Tax=Enterococcus viikkiensis TaxID=930854 RepID=A0ABU3FNB4_9ENTE|nr:glycosyltransferase family 2 protein [Enterococcus viikkiensis]MDT2827202.1 glycosyltransferase family 2 protein [Enterococcus viikkiensis]MDU6524349.1 glycosyltransferase family 2 protein [Enterococcus sp.]
MENEIVSIVMTVYNGEHTIKSTVQSLLDQTYANIELIIVNDGSTDNTHNILKNIARKDNRIKIFNNPRYGRSKSLNYALSKCSGKYIANIDADDLAHPKRIEIQYRFMEDHPNCGVLCSQSLIIYNNDTVVWDDIDYSANKYYQITRKYLKRSNPISHPSIMFNTKVISSNDLYYDESLTKIVDYDLWIRLCRSEYVIDMYKENLVAKRIHKNQSFENKNRINYLKAVKRVQKRNWSGELTIKDQILVELKFIYGLLPQRFRMWLRERAR